MGRRPARQGRRQLESRVRRPIRRQMAIAGQRSIADRTGKCQRPKPESDDRKDAVPLEELTGLIVQAAGRAFLDLPQDRVAGRFDSHEDVEDSRAPVQGQQVGVELPA